MKITIKYFASIREVIGHGSTVHETSATTLALLRDELIASGPAHADALVHLALLLDQRGDATEARRLRARARRQLAGDVGSAP